MNKLPVAGVLVLLLVVGGIFVIIGAVQGEDGSGSAPSPCATDCRTSTALSGPSHLLL